MKKDEATTTTAAVGAPLEQRVGRLRVMYADAMDAQALQRGEPLKAPLTDKRVFDDDIEVTLTWDAQ